MDVYGTSTSVSISSAPAGESDMHSGHYLYSVYEKNFEGEKFCGCTENAMCENFRV